MDLSNQKQFNSEGATMIVMPESLARFFEKAAEKPEQSINDQNFEAMYGYKNPDPLYAANHSPYSEYSVEGKKSKEEEKRRDYATRSFIRGLELSTTEIFERLMDRADNLRSLASMGDTYFGRAPTDKDMLYVREQNGQITFASKDQAGARIATANDKATLEAQNEMCIIGLSSDEVQPEETIYMGGNEYTKPAYIKSHALEEERMNASIAEIEDTAKKISEGDITPDQLSPYAQYLVAPETFENAPAPEKQSLVPTSTLLPQALTPMS